MFSLQSYCSLVALQHLSLSLSLPFPRCHLLSLFVGTSHSTWDCGSQTFFGGWRLHTKRLCARAWFSWPLFKVFDSRHMHTILSKVVSAQIVAMCVYSVCGWLRQGSPGLCPPPIHQFDKSLDGQHIAWDAKTRPRISILTVCMCCHTH